MHRNLSKWNFLLAAIFLLLPAMVGAAQFIGQVVGVIDGDTISVLRYGKAAKVRLHGIDTPEKRQAFGTKAREFTSNLVFKKAVTVIVRDTDRYGRIVGEVLLPGGRHLNRELVRVGMAWWYRRYAPDDTTLANLEAQARMARRGLWADASPVPPWEWRKQRRTGTIGAAPTSSSQGTIIGNRRSKIYHWPGCPSYDKVSLKNRVPFPSREAAEAAGYRAARNCR